MHRLKEPLKFTFYRTDSGSAGGLPACRSSRSWRRTDGVNCPSQWVGTLRRRRLAFVGQTGSYSPSYDVYLANPNGSNPRRFYADVGKQRNRPADTWGPRRGECGEGAVGTGSTRRR